LGYLLAWLVNFCTPYFINPEHLNWVSLFLFLEIGDLAAVSVSISDHKFFIIGRSIWLYLGRIEPMLRGILLLLHAGDEGQIARGIG
jgi:hypothetical protein